MAINNNNVQNVKFLRNQTPFESRELARQALEDNKGIAADGTALLARYTADNDVKTLVGFVAEVNSTKYVTIFDVEGGSEEVEKLRKEINAKLGEGITSANTATAQLAALSGNAQSTSAETSVAGAKKYAYDLLGTLDYEDTAVAGEYVSEVDQVDGKIAVTRVELPSYADTAVAKKVVIAVAEDKGQIVVSRGEISSSAETMVLTDNADGGVNFEVNIDGASIVQDPTTNKIKVADSALTQYFGDEKTIHAEVDASTNKKTFNTLLQISATTPTDTNVKEQYNLVNASGETIGATIKIYKDSSLYNAYLGHMDDTIAGDPPVVTPGTGDAALCFIYHKEDGSYTLVPVNVESFLEESEFASGVTATNHIVHGVVDSTSEKDSQDTPVDFLTVGADGFKISGIKNEIDRKLNAVVENLDATVTGETANQHISISIEELDGKLVQSGLTITESNIANADDLAELSAKTVTNIKSTNSSIDISTANTADGTVEVDVITDADKIQMSGFTADNEKVFSGISESDSIATAFEKADTVVTGINTKVDDIDNKYISGVSVNNHAVTVANKVAPISITAATSAVTATSTEAIVVNTDNSGNITLGLATIDCGTY